MIFLNENILKTRFSNVSTLLIPIEVVNYSFKEIKILSIDTYENQNTDFYSLTITDKTLTKISETVNVAQNNVSNELYIKIELPRPFQNEELSLLFSISYTIDGKNYDFDYKLILNISNDNNKLKLVKRPILRRYINKSFYQINLTILAISIVLFLIWTTLNTNVFNQNTWVSLLVSYSSVISGFFLGFFSINWTAIKSIPKSFISTTALIIFPEFFFQRNFITLLRSKITTLIIIPVFVFFCWLFYLFLPINISNIIENTNNSQMKFSLYYHNELISNNIITINNNKVYLKDINYIFIGLNRDSINGFYIYPIDSIEMGNFWEKPLQARPSNNPIKISPSCGNINDSLNLAQLFQPRFATLLHFLKGRNSSYVFDATEGKYIYPTSLDKVFDIKRTNSQLNQICSKLLTDSISYKKYLECNIGDKIIDSIERYCPPENYATELKRGCYQFLDSMELHNNYDNDIKNLGSVYGIIYAAKKFSRSSLPQLEDSVFASFKNYLLFKNYTLSQNINKKNELVIQLYTLIITEIELSSIVEFNNDYSKILIEILDATPVETDNSGKRKLGRFVFESASQSKLKFSIISDFLYDSRIKNIIFDDYELKNYPLDTNYTNFYENYKN